MRKEAEKELTKLNKKTKYFHTGKVHKKDGKAIEGGRCMRGRWKVRFQ